ncbi:hypothetical protein CVT24_003534 [Panaeolus cyanescens]|uniref:Dihydroorotate dehydrogenase catalytic domain-containing protein n=1 Tax=Panaeolus cyanescens TaxID=181874 RepID=A0A409Y7L7_9AGAR|nr:hypothetical protein CVT24_003534 [Panaeolus cyanescens]
MAYAQPHPRLSVVSNSSQSSEHHSPTTTSTRFSLPSAPSIHAVVSGTKTPANRPNIYDRNLNKTRGAEVSAAAFAFLFSEMVQYTQKRVSGINDLERQLNTLGYRTGSRVLELMIWRAEGTSKAPKREIKLLSVLMMIHTNVWKAVFGKAADAIERSVENSDEYMIIDNDPPIERYISVPRDLSQLSCSSFTAGIVEAVLDGLCFPARVTAHNTPTSQHPNRTTILIKLEKSDIRMCQSHLSELNQADLTLWLSPIQIVQFVGPMVFLNTLQIEPALLNSSCAWSSDLQQLVQLYNSPFTGAVTTRTSTLSGFAENEEHTVSFATESVSTINSYGYSPFPLSHITASHPDELQQMVHEIQSLRRKNIAIFSSRIGIELNTSCPNIPNSPPSGYRFETLLPLLSVLAEATYDDPNLTIGLKLPPYTYRDQFLDVIGGLKSLGRDGKNPFSFLTCTNTLGSSMLFAEQVGGSSTSGFAVPTGIGGVGGELLHTLALGNVMMFKQLLSSEESRMAGLIDIKIIGVGGVTSKEASDRMRRAGADIVGCATLFGKEGVGAFQLLS